MSVVHRRIVCKSHLPHCPKEVMEMLSKAGLENRAQDRPSKGNDMVYNGTNAHQELSYFIRSPHQGKGLVAEDHFDLRRLLARRLQGFVRQRKYQTHGLRKHEESWTC